MTARAKTHEQELNTARSHPSQSQAKLQNTPVHEAASPIILRRAMTTPAPLTPENVLSLHRAIGNRAVQRVLSHRAVNTGQAASSSRQLIQTKLMVGAVGDQYEQEADRMAAQVVSTSTQPAPVNRQTDEKEVQRKPMLQCSGKSGSFEAGDDVESAINARRRGGSPLSEETRAFMEPRFGADFSNVRVHTDSESDRLNRSLQARAFTTGQDIFFKQSEYNPGTQGGRELLAHELTHVLQQSPAQVARAPKKEEEEEV